MADTERKNKKAGSKKMGGATAAKTGDAARDQAVLQEALASFGVKPETSASALAGNGHHTGAAATQGAKTVSQVLGEITWLMTQSPRHKAMTLADLEWLVMPAILLKQFRMFYKGEQPAGVVLWALTDDIVAKRIDAGNTRLTAAEWKSGPHLRIVDVVAPFGGEAEMREQVEKPPAG
jgi:cytolysin-activating lysine-acyltransferase